MSSQTLIDVIIQNDHDLISNTDAIDCPFSDHRFIVANLTIKSNKFEKTKITSRNLSPDNINKIVELLSASDIDTENIWRMFKEKFINIIDLVAPEKVKTINNKDDQFPWFDDELLQMKQARDYYFKTFKETELNQDWSRYKELRNSFNSLNRLKMISYFENKEAKDFKSCAKYWQFYSAHIKVKSDKSSNSKSMSITNGSDVVTDSSEIADLFNCFFTSIRPNSSIDYNDCSDFTLNHFNDLKKKNLITTPEKNF